MRALFIGLGVFIILILGTLFVVPSLVPSETYRTTIQQQLTQSWNILQTTMLKSARTVKICLSLLFRINHQLLD